MYFAISNNQLNYSIMKKVVVLTGAGISAESGIKTFRDSDGLWEGQDVMEVASPQGWNKNPELVLDFYNQRRRQLHEVLPNAAHKALVQLEEQYRVDIVTQNVDDLHERAGSSHVLHLHGELFKARSIRDTELIIDWKKDLNLGDLASDGTQLRPHIVWFGEEVPELQTAAELVSRADILMIVGTSMVVYPAAGLIHYAPADCPVYYIDPKPSLQASGNLMVIAEKAGKGVPELVESLLN